MGRKLDPRKLTIIAEIGEHPHQWPEMVKMARWAGADAVKVQLWRSSHFPKGEKTRTEEFPREQFREFIQVARGWGMLAGASVFDPAAVWLATSGDFLKLATREEHNLPLRLLCLVAGRTFGIPVLRSVDVLIVGKRRKRWPGEFTMACIPQYPAPMMRWYSLGKRRGGYSSHSPGYEDCTTAAACGTTVIEKHLCLGKNRNAWSLLPHEFKEMVDALRA